MTLQMVQCKVFLAKSELVVAEAGTFLILNFNDFFDFVAVPLGDVLGAVLAASTTNGSLDVKGFEGKKTWGVLPVMRALAYESGPA